MTILYLPAIAGPAQNFTTTLNDRAILFDLRWNDRNQRFEMDVTDDDAQTVLATGLAAVLGTDLFEPFNFDLGTLIVYDSAGQHHEADLDNLGESVFLVWFSDDELAFELPSDIPDAYVPEDAETGTRHTRAADVLALLRKRVNHG